MVVALIALFVALDGPATAARWMDGRLIKRGTVSSAQIRDRGIQTRDLSKAAVASLRRTPPSSITTRHLAPKAVDGAKLADGAVGSPQLAQKSVKNSNLAEGAVGSGQLAAGAVTASKIAEASVGAAAVADGGLQTKDIGDFYGSVSVDFLPFDDEDHRCQVAKDIAPQPSAPGQGNVIADDVVVVSPAAGWPDPVVVTANPGAGNTLRIVACRVGLVGGGAPSIDPGPTVFQYVAIDQP